MNDRSERSVPSDVNLERDLIVGMIKLDTDLVNEAVTTLEPGNFYSPDHRLIFDLVTEVWKQGDLIAPITIAEHPSFPHSREWLANLLDQSGGIFGNAARVAMRRVVELSQARDAIASFSESLNSLYAGNPVGDVVASTSASIDRIRADITSLDGDVPGLTTLAEVMARETTLDEWVIDGMMRRLDRAIIVADEGGGKSYFLRQCAVLTAVGLHPLLRTRLRNGPRRIFIGDFENRTATIQNQLKGIERAFKSRGMDYPDGSLLERPGGINLLDRVDRRMFETAIRKARPELVVAGPIYKMYDRKESNHEAQILEFLKILDDLQSRYEFALMLEHHAPMASSGRERDLRPVDSSLWQRWPEVGVALHSPVPNDDGSMRQKVSQWRPPRDPLWWPRQLIRGTGEAPFPFSGNFPAEVHDGQGVPRLKVPDAKYRQPSLAANPEPF